MGSGEALTERVGFLATIEALRRHARPDTAFTGAGIAAFRRWRRTFATHYRKMIGPFPARVSARVRVTHRVKCAGYTRERIVYRSSPHVLVPAFRLIPDGLARGERRPGILAAHGHGNGKADISGAPPPSPSPHGKDFIRNHNYDYAVQAVRRGYVVIAPDWIPFGERSLPPDYVRGGRDACDVALMASSYFGVSLLAQNIWDGMRAVDLLAADPRVDPRRLGVIGLSYGGTMTTHLLVNDARLKAGVVSGYISTVRGDALSRKRAMNSCGAQHLPGLLAHGDLPEVLGLAAPKPVLCEMARQEDCFYFPDMQRAYARVGKIYRAAGASGRLAQDAFPGRHMWSGRKAWDWLARHL